MIIADIESDGLLDTATKIHCAVFYNVEKGIWKEFTPDNIGELPSFLDKCSQLSFHNGVCFDIPLLEKVAHKQYMGVVYDTLFASRILWPDLEGKNPHSVDSWGKRFGIEKPKHEDWSKFSPEMLHRCKEDVKIQAEIYKRIQERLQELSVRDSRITNDKFNEILQFEQQVAAIIEQQAKNGFAFNLPLAYKLIDQLDTEINEIRDNLLPQMPIRVIRFANKETKAFNKNGKLTVNAYNWFNRTKFIEATYDVGGDFSKVGFEPFNLSSSQQVKDYLLSKGWKPKDYNLKKDRFGKPERDEKGKHIKMSPKSPKTPEDWEEVAEQIGDEKIRLLAMYNKANHRKHQIEGFIRNLRSDHRLEAQANTLSTNTTRMVHRIVVNVPKADPKVYYGKEMRSLFIAAPGKVLIGVDACALEARIEAHYIYPFDPSGADELINGDIHEKNSRIFGVSRPIAKSGKYALTYGCSKSTLAATLQRKPKEADRLYNAFWEGNPGLKNLKQKIEEVYEKYGYILAIDGRPLTIRYKHALINTLFQSAGSIVMKRALVLLHDDLENMHIRYWFVGNFHDEMQIECLMQDANFIGDLACAAIKKAGEYYKLNVEMKSEYKVGKSWDLTH